MNEDSTMLPVFQEHRALLFGIAYRMLGSVAEAEDMVQETFLRWQDQSMDEVKSAKAWLTTATTRLCIDHLRSARVRREEYVGVWLPEPLVETHVERGDRETGLADSLSTAFLVLLETLTPAERAVFLLREVFEYEYDQIGRIIEKTESNCRQMVRRAREHVAAGKSRFQPSPGHDERLLKEFLRTCREGDSEGLLALLSEDAALYSDGGGKVPAAPEPVVGKARVARFLIGVSKLAAASGEFQFARVNSTPGILRFQDGQLVQTTALQVDHERIVGIYIVRNPDKLKHVTV
jgi:RNA polymerase sigma-70 factor, ECF subfamily